MGMGCNVPAVIATSGQSPTDFIALAGFGPTLANMGLAGAVGTAYVLLVGGDLNGPVIGAILTIVGLIFTNSHPFTERRAESSSNRARLLVRQGPISIGWEIGIYSKLWS